LAFPSQWTRNELDAGSANFLNISASDIHKRDRTRATETKRRQTFEKRDRCLERVHELERKLLISSRWTPESPEWAAATEKVQQRNYRRAVDILEALVVSRLFELTKMNMSDICASYLLHSHQPLIIMSGYKLRQHIAKSLQSRSHAIKKALEKYNEAAATHDPPAPALTWEQVVDYAFLSDFDLLRDARQDVREKPWACPINRVLRDQYFKVERAQEDIKRLDVEIRRVITYIVDETEFLRAKEAVLVKSNPIFAHQISVYRMERGRANSLHVQRFEKLAKHSRFTGDITPGQSVLPLNPRVVQQEKQAEHGSEPLGLCPDDDFLSDPEDDDLVLSDITYKLLSISTDQDSQYQSSSEE
jgi:hypothetical protein